MGEGAKRVTGGRAVGSDMPGVYPRQVANDEVNGFGGPRCVSAEKTAYFVRGSLGVGAAYDSPMHLTTPGREPMMLSPEGPPRVVGILNATPDSFSDGGEHASVDAAVRHALHMAGEGAAWIDIGGESTRPGAERVGVGEQIDRVVPVVRAVRAAMDEAGREDVWVSVDTTRPAVAEAALDAGAQVINDISAAREGPGDEPGAMLRLAAGRGVPIVLMHMLGQPATMQREPVYADVVAEVIEFLQRRRDAAAGAGVPESQVVLDPGIGFGKTLEHNLRLLGSLDRLVALGCPVLLGASRKRFIATLVPRNAAESRRQNAPCPHLGGTISTTALAVAAGVHLFRVHDVAPNAQAAIVAARIAAAR